MSKKSAPDSEFKVFLKNNCRWHWKKEWEYWKNLATIWFLPIPLSRIVFKYMQGYVVVIEYYIILSSKKDA